MAFDAGSIEATLTLNRNPFTAGLAAARTQARNFAKEKYTATANIDVDAGKATAEAVAFRKLLGTLDDQTGKLTARTRTFGDTAGQSFDSGGSHFEKMASLIIAGAPIIASVFTAAAGAVGALVSGLVIAGAGAGAFALVAIPAFKKIKDAVAAGQEEINKLPPGLRQAAIALQGLQKQYAALQKATEGVVGVALASWFNAGTAALKSIQPLVVASAKAFDNVGQRARIFFEGAWWKTFVTFLSNNVMPVISRFGVALFDIITIIGNFTMAIWNAGGDKIFASLLDGLSQFALWTDKIGQNKTFQQFMDAAVRSLPVVGALLGSLIEFILKLAIGLEPLGTLIIRVFTGIFDTLNSMPIPVIQGIALGIAAIWAAISIGATGPVGLAIGVLAGLAAVFINLYETNDRFRAGLQTTVDWLQQTWQPIWDTIVTNFNTKIKPAWDGLVATVRDNLIPALQRFGAVFMEEVWPKIQPFVDEITGTLIPAILRFLGALANIIAFLTDVFGPTVASELGSAVTVFQGAFDTIAGLLDVFTGIFTGNWTTFTQGITEITRGFWTIVAGMFGLNLDQLKALIQGWDADIQRTWSDFWNGIVGFFQSVWKTIEDLFVGAFDILTGHVDEGTTRIGRAFARIANLFRDPINWVINTVINDGIIGAWNQVMGWIGVGGIAGRVPSLPAFGGAFAAGGAVQGGTPGKDSVPILAMPGEYVLSTKAVQKMGGLGVVDAMHSAARGDSASGPTFAAGGPIPRYALGGPVASTVSMWSLFSGQVASLFNGLSFGHAPMGGQIGDAITQIPGAMVRKVLGAVQAKLESIVVSVITSIFGGGTVGGDGGARGWIIAHESGGNPRAQNPTSSASGLYQMIDGTWKAYGGSTAHAKDASVAEQDAVADRYVAARYGSWQAAQAFWQAHGYYDNGGWLPPGTTMATNMTGSPEAILTMNQFRSLASSRDLQQEDIAAIVQAIISAGVPLGGGNDTYNVMLPERATVRELADTLDFKRRVVHRGRYRR